MNAWFDAITNLISTIIEYLVNSTNALLNVLGFIAKSVYYVFVLAQFMPAPIQVILIALLSYIIIVNVLKLGG